MRLRSITEDDSAVSPVIGVILMVAITVILAAVIASFVLGLGPSDTAPTAQFEFDENSSGTAVTITHTSGDALAPSEISTSGDVNATVNWNDNNGTGALIGKSLSGSEFTSGDSITVVTTTADWELSVVWSQGDQSSRIASRSA